ncbi:MAG: virulence RhuM family protein, partial [Bacteroidales bacterium]|nr:virulence RhuM family protein [Bacteroidales bacterium]
GYRVKSQRGTQFRIWANSVLKDYLIKGYAVKNGLVQQKYDDLKALVDVMGRTMGYLDSPAGQRMSRKAAVQVNLQST